MKRILTADGGNIPVTSEEEDRKMGEVFIPTPRKDTPRLCEEVDFEPLGNWCLIKSIDSGVMKSGLYLPEAYGQSFKRGLVVATGEGTIYGTGAFVKCTVKVGDTVLWGKAGGLEVMLKEGGFILARESEMFGIVSSSKPNTLEVLDGASKGLSA